MNKFFAIAYVTIAVFVASCSVEHQQEPLAEGATVSEVLISAKDFEYDPASRTSFNITSSGAEFLWAENDTVGIFPDKGTQVEFPMSQGAGTKTAAFDGGGWGLKSGNTYYAYYPFSRKHYMAENAKNNISVSYEGQVQNGSGTVDHLGAYDFMAAEGTSPTNGSLNFNFTHLGALVQLTIDSDEPITTKKLTLISDNDDFVIDGYVDITNAMPHIIPTTKSKSFEIGVEQMSPQINSVFYFMLAPTDLSKSNITLTIEDEDGIPYNLELPSKNFQSGKAYALNVSFEVEIRYNGYDYVDLALPSGIKWATCNIGADYPSDYGDYFAWGETETKDTYTTANSKWYNVSFESLQSQGVIDDDGNLTAQYDAAKINWGLAWRMPTKNDFDELSKYCNWTWTSQNGHSGHEVTGRNGNSIFLPAAGGNYYNEVKFTGRSGYYWTSTIYVGSENYWAYQADFSKVYSCGLNNEDREGGFPIRPVTK